MAQNELAPSMDELSQSFRQELSTQPVVEAPEPEPEVEVEASSFWDDEPQSTELEPEQVEESLPEGTITYKADGEVLSATMEEAQKALSLAKGARKAFSDRARLKKRLQEIEKTARELETYKKTWDDLEAIRDNPALLYETITGQPFSTFIEQEMERRRVYNEASPAERHAMDREDEALKLRRELEKERRERESVTKRIEQREYETEKTQLSQQMQREFLKHELPPTDNPQIATKLRKMLWRDAISDIKEYIADGYKLNDAMIRKAFKDSAAAITAFYSSEVEKGVVKQTELKKAAAREKAQVASTKNYKPVIDKKLASMNPLDLFHAIRRR